MSNYHCNPAKKLSGSIQVPGDKSISHRALIFASIAKGDSEISGLLMGQDNLATLAIMRALGVAIDQLGDGHFLVHGAGLNGLRAAKNALDCGNSGTGMRLLTGLLSAQNFSCELIGDASLSKRPMGRVINPLRQMGAEIMAHDNNVPPLKIIGKKLTAITYEMPIASAQVKSCLLLAGLYADGITKIVEPAPSRDHTERMMIAFKAPIIVDKNVICIEKAQQLIAANIDVPGDISSAAFFMVAATIVPNSEIVLTRVGINPTRIGIINILRAMGANISLENHSKTGDEPVADIRIKSANLHGIEIDPDQVPLAIDEFPVIFIAAACAKGKTILRGAKELRVKETDRIAAMAEGLQKCGIHVEVLDDGLIIEGGKIKAATVDSFDDHRIAMAFAVASAVAEGNMIINHVENVATSFPNFVELTGKIGLKINP